MAKLKNDHKSFIVKSLACYNNPSDVVKEFNETFNVEVSKSQVSFYNPENNSSKNLSEKWREMFRHTRNEYKEEVVKHDIAAKGYRLGVLQKQLKKADRVGNMGMVLQILEQAAKEVGGIFEGKGNDGDDGGGTTINNYIQQIYNKIENKR